MIEVYAVVYTENQFIPGDERSRTNAGHGYPEYTIEHRIFKEFKSREEMLDWVIEENNRLFSRKVFKAYKCEPLAFKTTVEIRARAIPNTN